jgi:Tfp pilus assembly protein PilX
MANNKVTLNKHNKGIALMTVVILIIILTILSSVMLSILANQNRYIEHNIARTKARYATEATMVRALDSLRRNPSQSETGVTTISGKYDNLGQYWNVGVGVTNAATVNIGINVGVTAMILNVDYTTLQ